MNGTRLGGVSMDKYVTQLSIDDFERLMRENQRVVYQIAYGVLGNSGDAEDVAQDAFVRAFEKLTSLREPERFRGWIYQITRRLALNRLRSDLRTRRREELISKNETLAPSADSLAESREFESRVRREIELLPEKMREVLLLCAIEGLEASVVGEMLRIPEGTVRSRLHLARKQLLRVLSA
jgi:RNA polymerase sigma-70 factor (ECF subfamily)